MPVFQSAITVHIQKPDETEDQVMIVAALTDGPEPVWELRRNWTTIRFRSQPAYSYKDAIWQLYDLCQITGSDLSAFPASPPAYDIQERMGNKYCMKRRETIAEELAASPYIFRLYTFPGADLVAAASMVAELQYEGAYITLTALALQSKLLVPDISCHH